MAVITTNTNLASVSYVAGEIIDIQNNATVTMDATPSIRPGTIQCTSRGKFRIENFTNNIITLTQNTNTNRLTFTGNGVFEARGLMVDIYTGTGSINQSIDFNTISGGVIDYPSYLEVETGNATNVFKRWAIVPSVGNAGLFFTNFSEWGAEELGWVCLYDSATKIMSFGDGVNGAVVPLGARVRIPNIHITCAVNNNTITSRAQTNFNSGGNIDLECVSFSNAYYFIITSANTVRIRSVGAIGRLPFGSVQGAIDIIGLCNNLDPRQSTTVTTVFSNCSEFISLEDIFTVSHGVTTSLNAFSINTCFLSKCKNVKSIVLTRAASYTAFAIFNILNQGVLFEDLTSIGNRFSFNNITNATLKNIRFSDTLTGVVTAINPGVSLILSNCNNLIFDGFSLVSGGSPSYNQLISGDATNSGLIFKNFILNAANNTHSLLTGALQKSIFYNCDISNFRNSTWLPNLFAKDLTFKKFLNNQGHTIPSLAGSEYDFVQASSISGTMPLYFENGMFHTLVASPATTGNLCIGAFGKTAVTTISGVEEIDWYYDNNGLLFVNSNSIEVLVSSRYTIKSITSFQNISPILTGVNTNGFSYDFRIGTPKEDISTKAWLSLTGTNLSAAISNLLNYDSNKGFNMQLRLTSVGVDATRNINLIRIPTNNDPNYNPIVGTTRITVEKAIPNSLIAIFDNTNPNNPVLLDTVLANSQGVGFIDAPYNFDGTTIPILIKVRKVEYEPIELQSSYSNINVNLVISQKKIVDITGSQIYGRGNSVNKALVNFIPTSLLITIGNGRVTGESLYDAIAEFQTSDIGILYPPILNFDGKDGLLLNGWKFRRSLPTDSNSGIDIAITVDGNPSASPDIEDFNSIFYGSIDFRATAVRSIFNTNDASLVAKAVWEYPVSSIDTNTTTNIGRWIKEKLFYIFGVNS